MASLFFLHVSFTFLSGLLLPAYLSSAQPYCEYKLGRKFPDTHGCAALEHCSGEYNHQTGVCTNPQQCEPGWMGPRCQYVNLALNDLNSDVVFDGDMTTHRRIDVARASVNLNGIFVVSALNIHAILQQQDITITIKDKSNNICFHGHLPVSTPTIYFSRPFMTDTLLIEFSTVPDIKEIEVFGGKNIALWKETTQSSIYIEDGIQFTSDKAVDGNGTGIFKSNTCTHTRSGLLNPRWTLQLGKASTIIAIKIKNRSDNQHRIDGFQLFASTLQGNVSIYNDSNTPAAARDSILIDSSHMPNIPVTGITIEGSNSGDRILTLCEVYVYACRPENDGSENCISFCPENCKKGAVCSSFQDFTCPACKEGWKGSYCDQPITCRRPSIQDPLHISRHTNRYTYMYNQTIQFYCNKGYNIEGSATKICKQYMDFERNLPHCTAIKCRRPLVHNPLHISRDTYKDVYIYNQRIQFYCEDGYNIEGPVTKICKNNYTDFERNLPHCTAITCQRPSIQSPLQISSDTYREKYTYNQSIKFYCKDGFNLRGPATKLCKHSGDFGKGLPHCTEVQCRRSTLDSDHLFIDPPNDYYSYNTEISFSCEEGFNLVGQSNTICGNNNTFMFNSTGVPKCEAVHCSLSSFRQKELMILRERDLPVYGYNSTVMFHCEKGFNLKGSHFGICGQNNSFLLTEGPPFCEAVQCKLPDFIDKFIYNVYNQSSYKYKETVTFRCKSGHETTENLTGICDDGNNFTFAFPDELFICQAVQTEADSLAGPIAGGTVGSLLAVFVVIVIAVVIFQRQRRAKNANSKSNEDFHLDNIDNQYAEVNIEKKNRKQNDKRDQPNEQTSTYYNLNSSDVEKAKLARQEVYYEFSPLSSRTATAISVSELRNYVERKKRENGFFAAQFKKFYTGLQFPATAAVAPGNRSKNKYRNIYPYDDTRVALKPGNGPSDFINASFIHGYGNLKSYIAAQGPLVNTIDDFWWMVWIERCEKIVMLTNLIEDDKVKCIQYWPEKDKMNIGNMSLEVVDIESFADFTIRTICIKNNKERRIIRQFHFTAWPDKGVPLYASSLVHFHSKVIHTADQGKGPLVVHCSAGIGRTGTFIALDILTHQAKESGFVDVFGCVETLRRQRVNMVQTLEQYVFLHDVLLEALMCTSSDPSTAEFPQIYQNLLNVDPESRKRNIDLYFEDISAALSSPPESAYRLAKDPANKLKNRYSNILPVDTEMPELKDEDDKRIYINAVFLPAYKTKRSFIVTQMPLKQTVEDFWRLIFDQKVSTIVMLNETEQEKSTGKQNIGMYWPDLEKTSEFGIYRVTTQKQENEEQDYTVIDLLCCLEEGEKEEKNIRIFKCNFWPDSTTVPNSVLKFLKMINAVELHNDRNNTGPVVVQCMNGAEKSGLFCVLQVVLERMKIEQDVAIHQIIQQMRSVRPSIIPNVEQLKFCYDAVMEFLNQFDAYSNFQ